MIFLKEKEINANINGSKLLKFANISHDDCLAPLPYLEQVFFLYSATGNFPH